MVFFNINNQFFEIKKRDLNINWKFLYISYSNNLKIYFRLLNNKQIAKTTTSKKRKINYLKYLLQNEQKLTCHNTQLTNSYTQRFRFLHLLGYLFDCLFEVLRSSFTDYRLLQNCCLLCILVSSSIVVIINHDFARCHIDTPVIIIILLFFHFLLILTYFNTFLLLQLFIEIDNK